MVALSIKYTFSRLTDKVKIFPGECIDEKKHCQTQPGINFYDGCNICTCSMRSDKAASCSRTMCNPFKGTLAEYQKYCEERVGKYTSNRF